MRARALAKYEFILPLERGDGTTVIRGHYGNTTTLEVGVRGIVDPDHLFDSASTQNMKQSERMISSYRDASFAQDVDLQMSVRNADKRPIISQNTSLQSIVQSTTVKSQIVSKQQTSDMDFSINDQQELIEDSSYQDEGADDTYSVMLTYDEVDLIRGNLLKVCKICNAMKPPRTHHCS